MTAPADGRPSWNAAVSHAPPPSAPPPAEAREARDEPENGVLWIRVGDSIAEVERRLILATLEQLRGDKRRAARQLGISLKTLYSRLAVYAAAETGRPTGVRGGSR